MKKILCIMAMALFTQFAARAAYPVGVSLSMVKEPTAENLAEIKAAGVEYVEIVFNYFWRNVPENECYTRAYRVRRLVEEAGLKVWSCHLPFSRSLDISVVDPELREKNVQTQERMIRLAAIFHPQRLVLHPSAEPIEEQDRAVRLQNSSNSIGRLALVAKEIGTTLCIENLPRTCLARDSGELMQLIADYPDVKVCFDSNHLLKEQHAHFFEAVGNRIGTVHISDYDRTDERHWLPGEGVIDWPDFYSRLKASDYRGVFMHEVRAGEKATPENVVEAYHRVILGKKN